MAKVYIETRPKGRPEGSHIDDYVVDDHVDHILATFKTHAKRSIPELDGEMPEFI